MSQDEQATPTPRTDAAQKEYEDALALHGYDIKTVWLRFRETERELSVARADLKAERDKYLKLSEAYEGCDVELKEAERDVIVLCLRLCMEPNDSHSPDTADVLNRWRKVWEAVAGGMPVDAATRKEPEHG